LKLRKVEGFISDILRLGVELSGLLMVTGIGLFLWTGDDSCSFGVLSWDWVLFGSSFFQPSHILFLGFLILVSTPLMRVFASVVAYSMSRDWVYTVITGCVLSILIIGIILGVG
jgi:uncharacterized membrane protein